MIYLIKVIVIIFQTTDCYLWKMSSQPTHFSRDLQREVSHLGHVFQISNFSLSIDECLHILDQAFKKSESERVKCSLKSKINLVHELQCV